jgi:hypothetical protein
VSTCRLDDSSSTYNDHLRRLRKKFPRIDRDLAAGFEQILQDPTKACQATRVPGVFDPKALPGVQVWKYRFRCSDAQKGRSGGYRLMAVLLPERRILYPFCLYTKNEYEGQPPAAELKRWVTDVMDALPGMEGM